MFKAKKILEFVLTIIILIGIGVLGIRARNEEAAISNTYITAMAGTETQSIATPYSSLKPDDNPYVAAKSVQDPSMLQNLAQQKAMRILSTGDVSRLQTEMEKTGILKQGTSK